MSLSVSTAGWTGLREAHMLDDLHEFRALAERIEAWILSKREELHVALPAGPVEPFHCLLGFAQRDVGRGNIVGRHTLARASAFEPVQNLTGRGLITGRGVGVGL